MIDQCAFDRFAESALQALFFARVAVSEHGGSSLSPAHLLLGLIKAAPDAVAPFVRDAHAVQTLAECLVTMIAAPELTGEGTEVPLDESVKEILLEALRRADGDGVASVTAEHLLTALLSAETTQAATCLQHARAGQRDARAPFELQPVLRGHLIELRPLRAEDYDALYAVGCDPLIWEQHPISDRYKEDQFRVFFREALESRGALIAIDRNDGCIIGSSRFHGYDAERSEIEIGWTFLARSHWGGRYNGEMKRLMLDHAFRFIDRVIFIVGVHNIRSQRAVERIGAVRAGRKRDDLGREAFVYEITAATDPAR